jgi:hypothetical protein
MSVDVPKGAKGMAGVIRQELINEGILGQFGKCGGIAMFLLHQGSSVRMILMVS